MLVKTLFAVMAKAVLIDRFEHFFSLKPSSPQAYGCNRFLLRIFAKCAVSCDLGRCLTVQSSSSLWPQWWPPLLPMDPAALGMPSVSSLLSVSGGSRESLMVSVLALPHQRPSNWEDNTPMPLPVFILVMDS